MRPCSGSRGTRGVRGSDMMRGGSAAQVSNMRGFKKRKKMKKKRFQHQRGLCCWSGSRLKTQTLLQILLIIIWRLPRCALMSPSPRMTNGIRGGQKNNKGVKSPTFSAYFYFSLRDIRRWDSSGRERKSSPFHEGRGDKNPPDAQSSSSAPLSQSFSPSQRHDSDTHLLAAPPQSNFSGGHVCLPADRKIDGDG